MKSETLYQLLKKNFPELLPDEIHEGKSFFWKEILKHPRSTRVMRVHEDAHGMVTEIKLAASSLVHGRTYTLPLPATGEDVCVAVRKEITLLEAKK